MQGREEQVLSILRRWTTVGACLDKLRDRERAVILARLGGASLAETARGLRITKARARSIEERAMRELADMLLGPIEPPTSTA